MSSMIIAADTGGSKTHLVLYDKQGKQLSEIKCIGLGKTLDGEAPLEYLDESINQLLKGRNRELVRYIIVNVGGGNETEIHNRFLSLFPSAHVETYRESSGILMNALREAKQVDCLLMAGTGTIGMAGKEQRSVIVDGWSPFLGDSGSGFWIGMQAICRSLRALEMQEPLSALTKQITGCESSFQIFEDTQDQMKQRDEIRRHFMPLERYKVAKWTKVAADEARQGDAFSREIFEDAGKELALTVLRALQLSDITEKASVLILGGLTKCVDLWGTAFDKMLLSRNRGAIWHTEELDLTAGALAYAKHIGCCDVV